MITQLFTLSAVTMSLKSLLQIAFEHEESKTVSDSFGGDKLSGTRSPAFTLRQFYDVLTDLFRQFPDETISNNFQKIEKLTNTSIAKDILLSCLRFSFLIELTNIKIASTKMKTRWVPGKIIKIEQGSYKNIQGEFSPGNDPRSNSFDNCYEIFEEILVILSQNPASSNTTYLSVLSDLSSISSATRVPYEFVFTYRDSTLNPIHQKTNIRLVSLDDLCWLIKARPIFGYALSKSAIDKISTKTYKTDRAQTGVDQTNRAKRWEVLSGDFQQASIEDCWAVEKMLLSTLIGFDNFPSETLSKLQAAGIAQTSIVRSYCPVTLETFDFLKFIEGSEHGYSSYQVGHLNPLKAGGRHTGTNVAWMTDNGNRIQGDFSIETIRQLLKDISDRMIALKI